MTTHRLRNPRERGARTGVFNVGARSIELPCAAVLAEELRRIADPHAALVYLESVDAHPADISIANPAGLVRSQFEGVEAWLKSVTTSHGVDVPAEWQNKLGAKAVVVMPVLSPVAQLGLVAFPVQSNFDAARREAEHLLSDFALRLERHQREQLLLGLREVARLSALPNARVERLEPTNFRVVSSAPEPRVAAR